MFAKNTHWVEIIMQPYILKNMLYNSAVSI